MKSEAGKSELVIDLKYYAGRPVIERIEREDADRHAALKRLSRSVSRLKI